MNELFRPAENRKQLRPYQERAIALLRSSLAKGFRRVVCQLPTGGGKSLMAAKITEGARSKSNRVIFTVPTVSLIDQTVAAFEAEGLDGIGVMQANHPRTDTLAPIQVASVQTLARRQIPYTSIVIVDEVHIRSEVIDRLMKDRPEAVFLGLSATPWRRGIGKTWQDLVVASTTRELIDEGYLSPFRVFAAAHPDLTGIKTVAGDYHEGELAERMGEGALCADVVTTWLEKAGDRPTLVFGVNRAHAAQLHERFMAAGVASAYVDMNTDRVERGLIERRFRAGDVRVACSVRTLTTGIDWPVACIVDAAPTRSEMLHVQKIGRGLRVNPPWEDCIVLDHSDNTLRLGMVTDIHHETLDDGKPKQASQNERKAPLPKECGQCGFIKPPKTRKCPACGHEAVAQADIDTVDGELVEIGSRRKAEPTMADKQAFWSMALWLDGERGKGGKYALALYKGKFDSWPRGLQDTPKPADQAFMNYEKSRRIRWAKKREKEQRKEKAA